MAALMARVLLLLVLGVCPRLLRPGLGDLLVPRLWWRRLSLVAEVAAVGGVMLALVLLMPYAWVL